MIRHNYYTLSLWAENIFMGLANNWEFVQVLAHIDCSRIEFVYSSEPEFEFVFIFVFEVCTSRSNSAKCFPSVFRGVSRKRWCLRPPLCLPR